MKAQGVSRGIRTAVGSALTWVRGTSVRRDGGLRAAFEDASVGMALLDPEDRILRTNPALRTMLGDDARLRGARFPDLFVPSEAGDGALALLGRGYRGEGSLLCEDGETFWGRVTVSPLRREGGGAAALAQVEDVSALRAAEGSLREIESRFRQLFENSEDLIFVHDDGGRFVDCNARACTALGYSREELLRLSARDVLVRILSEEERRLKVGDTLWARVLRAAPGELVGLDHNALRCKNGKTFPVEAGVGAIDYEGERLMYVTARDVTERVEVEAELRRNEARLAAAQRIAHVGNWEYDFDGDEARWSDEMYRIFGFAPGEFAPNYRSFFRSVHPDDMAAVRRTVRRALYGGEGGSVEYRVLRPSNEERAVLTRFEVVMGREGRARSMFGTIQDVTERKALEERLTYHAFHDALTGLPNRKLFVDRLEHALAREDRREDSVALLFLDIDDFKHVNDSLGHEVGDGLLVEVGKRLSACVRPADTVARLGGDEFTVLLEDVSGTEDAVPVAERIAERLGEPFEVANQELFVTASIGIVPRTSARGPGELLRFADLAMYRAKETGKARYVVYEEALHMVLSQRMELERDLRRGMSEGQFRVFYQPQVVLESGEPSGFEALLRWEHPERGLLDAGSFVPVAEAAGLMSALGRCVLEDATVRAREWRRARPHDPPFVSVNLSAREFHSPRLVEELERILGLSGVVPADLVLELPERLAVDDASLSRLEELKALGVRVAVDDFGTGRPSLTRLETLPVDFLKIDGSFTGGLGRSLDDTVLVSGVASIARSLGIDVVAEGVETRDQAERLRDLGCGLAQGYLFSRPVSPEEVPRLLAGTPNA